MEKNLKYKLGSLIVKIVHLTDLALPHIGGMEYVVYRYSTMQREMGHESLVITTKLPNTKRRETRSGVPYYRFSKVGLSILPLSLLKKVKPDIVHTHSYIAALTLSYFSKINSEIPILRHIHDVYIGKYKEYSGWESSAMYEKFEKFAITLHYDGYITPSQYTRRKLIELGLQPSRIHVVPPGIDLERFGKSDSAYVRKKYRIPKDKKIIGFVGRLSTGKGPQDLIEAAKNLDAYIVIVGPNPDPKTSGIRGIKDDLQRMVRKYGMEKRVIFAGKIRDEEIPLFYDSFDIFCLPSISEGFGMSIGEALASGKPVVSYNITAIPEIVKDGQNGFLVKPKDIESLKDRLEILLNNEDIYKKISANARKSVMNYTWENSLKRLMKVYSLYLS